MPVRLTRGALWPPAMLGAAVRRQIMCNPSSTGGPAGELKEAIESSFGSVDALKEKFNAAAAGGWWQQAQHAACMWHGAELRSVGWAPVAVASVKKRPALQPRDNKVTAQLASPPAAVACLQNLPLLRLLYERFCLQHFGPVGRNSACAVRCSLLDISHLYQLSADRNRPLMSLVSWRDASRESAHQRHLARQGAGAASSDQKPCPMDMAFLEFFMFCVRDSQSKDVQGARSGLQLPADPLQAGRGLDTRQARQPRRQEAAPTEGKPAVGADA